MAYKNLATLEHQLSNAWARLRIAEVAADQCGEEGIRSDIADMRAHIYSIQTELLKRNRLKAVSYRPRG